MTAPDNRGGHLNPITFRVAPSEKASLLRVAEAKQTTISAVIRQALKDHGVAIGTP